ncbi:11100_t:CDS:1, partial [Gigaspora margarita]
MLRFYYPIPKTYLYLETFGSIDFNAHNFANGTSRIADQIE